MGTRRKKRAARARTIWVVEHTASHNERLQASKDRAGSSVPITLRVYRVRRAKPTLAAETSYKPGAATGLHLAKARLVVQLLKCAGARGGIVVCSHRVASPRVLVRELNRAGLDFVIELHPATRLEFPTRASARRVATPQRKLRRPQWKQLTAITPGNATYVGAKLGSAVFAGVNHLYCFAVSSGKIADYRRGLLVGLSSLSGKTSLNDLARILGWTRWLRLVVRRVIRMKEVRVARAKHSGVSEKARGQPVVPLLVRSNLKIARRLDEVAAKERSPGSSGAPALRGELGRERRVLNVVELFAGAGGMGLGFLLASTRRSLGYRILLSAELHPIYVNTLRKNHDYLRSQRLAVASAVPETIEPLDLRTARTAEQIRGVVENFDGVDVLIGGPPCQGFSNANRNSWSRSNPNNHLVDSFLRYVRLLRPKVLLLENVQGILWTANRGDTAQGLSVATHVAASLAATGYRIYPKVLDAAWYGVPQHRSRFFLLGVHRDLGYGEEDFGPWGPFPRPTHGPGTGKPYVTVQHAIGDLPRIGNGDQRPERTYVPRRPGMNPFLRAIRSGAPRGMIWDHVTSRHAAYVIERYRRIRQGGNWRDVANMLTNYAAVERTHSNIYRRLRWNEPSITIGHYRKSMIVHPSQNRGLSLREAARLQSFPDWFRFAGSENGADAGLMHKQQQLANAVCPLMSRSIAEFLLNL